MQENRHNQVCIKAFCYNRAVELKFNTVESNCAINWFKVGHVMITITRLINFNVFVKYFELLFYLSSGNLIFLIHAANTSPNSQMVTVPPLVIALIPQRQMPQFKAKKNTSIMQTTKTDNWDSLDANIDMVITTVRIAYKPDIKTDDDMDDVELNTCANADCQK